jgi:hypothetical protein
VNGVLVKRYGGTPLVVDEEGKLHDTVSALFQGKKCEGQLE